MPVTGPLSHLDISVGHPARSIAFYDTFLTALGFLRIEGFTSEFSGASPTRAGWRLQMIGGASFGIEVRPARPEDRDLRYDRYKPGPHHIAFHAESEGGSGPRRNARRWRRSLGCSCRLFRPARIWPRLLRGFLRRP
jgi:catechol 2,3-dioxygenase-like lactoylglutathione lyase family enzyme